MKQPLLLILFLGLLIAFATFGAFGNDGWVKLLRLRRYNASLETQNASLIQNNSRLKKQIADLKNPKYLEHCIRDELGYLKEGEILFEMSEKPGEP